MNRRTGVRKLQLQLVSQPQVVQRNRPKVRRNRPKLPRNRPKLLRNRTKLPRNRKKLPKPWPKLPRNRKKFPRNRKKLPRNRRKLSRNWPEVQSHRPRQHHPHPQHLRRKLELLPVVVTNYLTIETTFWKSLLTKRRNEGNDWRNTDLKGQVKNPFFFQLFIRVPTTVDFVKTVETGRDLWKIWTNNNCNSSDRSDRGVDNINDSSYLKTVVDSFKTCQVLKIRLSLVKTLSIGHEFDPLDQDCPKAVLTALKDQCRALTVLGPA